MKMRNKRLSSKAQIWISAVLYVLIVVSAMVIVLEVGIPVITNLKDRIALDNARNSMSALQSYITEISSEGPGSQRVVTLNVKSGKVYARNNKLIWQIETSSKIMEPRSRIDFGNLIFTALAGNSSVTAQESDDYCYYILDNGIIRVNITEFGGQQKTYENCSTNINTNQLINSITFIDEGKTFDDQISLALLNDPSSYSGTGRTELLEEGSYLSSATVLAYVNSTNYYYVIEITLDSGADFLTISLRELQKNT